MENAWLLYRKGDASETLDLIFNRKVVYVSVYQHLSSLPKDPPLHHSLRMSVTGSGLIKERTFFLVIQECRKDVHSATATQERCAQCHRLYKKDVHEMCC